MMSDLHPLWWDSPGSPPVTEPAQRFVVVTDVDGSLLAPGSRSVKDERAALQFLAARGIPLVINSSRTRAEIDRLRRSLQMRTPFICEHGSALFVPEGSLALGSQRTRRAVGGRLLE